ncbi:MAG: amino acid permease [Longimicrobiales bacterium]|nr:amino acid permease [Longimicrobiales bacterium]
MSEKDGAGGGTPREGGTKDRAPSSGRARVELERTLGLKEAFAIGVGTMIGAGIFVFPGMAAGEAGPAAAVSFGIGAVIALLVALPASELATAMPESGGGYYFVSRSLGGFLGTMVGVAQLASLIFASAFYLVGIGYYLNDLLARLGTGGLDPGWLPVPIIALAAAILLTVMSILGTRNTGALQNVIVGVLVIILAGFLGQGALDALGIFGRQHLPEAFAPRGYTPVLTTAALVFTSYLGFAQIAAVAGDIREPEKNLPRAMVGSVLIVGAFYVLTIFVSTSVFGTARLAELGETAIVEVAGELAGTFGALVIVLGGMLATISSANASILSSSRSVFALSRDGVLPEGAGRISERFRTPHVALLMAGGPVAVLVLSGRVETLAEVASLLHLFMYGLICVSMLVLRRVNPSWYDPAYRAPGYPFLPALGALVSFGLVAFMDPLSMVLGGGVLLVAALWFLAYRLPRMRVRGAGKGRGGPHDRGQPRRHPSTREADHDRGGESAGDPAGGGAR